MTHVVIACLDVTIRVFILIPTTTNGDAQLSDLLFQVVKKCNEGARKMEQAEQVINVENKLTFNKVKVSFI